jgi:hypothetical protein
MRDPRVDPRPGDVVGKYYPRYVDSFGLNACQIDPRVFWHGITKAYGSTCTIQTWRQWARNTEVIIHAAAAFGYDVDGLPDVKITAKGRP